MRDGTGLDLGPLQKLYRAGSYYPRPRSAVGCAMDGDTRNAVLALTAIILACAAILVGTHATELTGSVHQLFGLLQREMTLLPGDQIDVTHHAGDSSKWHWPKGK